MLTRSPEMLFSESSRISYELFHRLASCCNHRDRYRYPVLKPSEQWPPFRLGKRLYYANAMESAVSTMETEAVAARNVVGLLKNDLL
jgi:hypothetical protein